MNFQKAFEANTELISKLGKNKAFIVWGMGLYLDDSDFQSLADESLTDNGDDKKIDFLRYNNDLNILTIVQGYMAEHPTDTAKSNKASDLNTAIAWLLDGEIEGFPLSMRDIVVDIRSALQKDEIDQIEIIYLHNCGESRNVEIELKTTATSLKNKLSSNNIDVIYKEIGSQTLERLFLQQAVNMQVTDEIECPFKPEYKEYTNNWQSAVLTVTGEWLRSVYNQYGDSIFSANYRGFLGVNRRKINVGIRNTADNNPDNFWVYNNGITILTSNYEEKKGKLKLSGMSIINGAQTTGAIGSLPSNVDLSKVKILARVVQSSSSDLIGNIVKFNNTQNKITSWDSYGNDEQQKEIQRQFGEFNHKYSFKRGFDPDNVTLTIENCIQPLLSFIGKYKDANRSKTAIFESRTLYADAFDNVSARHILLVSSIHSALAEIKAQNRTSNRTSSSEKRLYELLAPLKSRHYVLSIIAEIITKLNSSFNNKKVIAFMPNEANGNNNSFNQLVEKVKPFVNLVVMYIANYDMPNDVYSHYNDSDSIEIIASDVEQKISVLKTISSETSSKVDTFLRMITQ